MKSFKELLAEHSRSARVPGQGSRVPEPEAATVGRPQNTSTPVAGKGAGGASFAALLEAGPQGIKTEYDSPVPSSGGSTLVGTDKGAAVRDSQQGLAPASDHTPAVRKAPGPDLDSANAAAAW